MFMVLHKYNILYLFISVFIVGSTIRRQEPYG